jgi:hypothetical protein
MHDIFIRNLLITCMKDKHCIVRNNKELCTDNFLEYINGLFIVIIVRNAKIIITEIKYHTFDISLRQRRESIGV